MTYSPVTLESLLSHQTWALRVARRLVREEDEAEDLVQRTWMAALRRPPQSQAGAKAWIRKVILNLARERHRRNQARIRHEEAQASQEGTTEGDALEAVSRDEIHRLLSERLMQLSEPYRTVVLQRFYEDLTSVEIAQRLGIPAGTVRWRLKMGLDQLRAELDRRNEGDRSRWVSALLTFVHPNGGRESLATPAPAAETSPFFASAAVLLVLGATALFGFFLLDSGGEARSAPVVLAGSAATRAPNAASDRTPGDAGPAPGGARVAAVVEPAAPTRRPDEDGLRIQVVTREGTPVPDAEVQVAREANYLGRTRSDAEGRAVLAPQAGDIGGFGLESTRGRISIRAVAPGRSASELVHVASPFTNEHTVQLVVGGQERTLRGRVRAPEGGPVAGALVAWFLPRHPVSLRPEGDFSSSSYLSGRTDEAGEFELSNLSDEIATVACFADGFAIQTRSTEALDGQPLEWVLERGATVFGTVRRPGGRPAADVPVTLESVCKTDEWATGLPGYDSRRHGFYERTRTDAAGRFRLEGVLASGRTRTLWVLDDELGLAATTSFRLENGAEVEWEAELTELPRLDLRLVDEHGRPLAGKVASIRRQFSEYWWARRVHTDPDGRVRVLDCPPGPLYLDLFPAIGTGPSLGWKRLQPSLEEQTIVIDSRKLVLVEGRLLDAYGAPAQREELIAVSLETTLETPLARTSDGRFSQILPPGYYLLLARADQTATKVAEARCPAGSTMDFGDVVIPEQGSLRLEQAVSAVGQHTSYALFKVSEEGEPKGALLVGQGLIQGSVSIPVYPGRYRIQVHEPDSSTPRAHIVRVRAGEETRLDTWR
jgi:RNA polymerase sigma-70 factor (ECF subfamily)